MYRMWLNVFHDKQVFLFVFLYSADPEQSSFLLSGLLSGECNLQKLGHINLVGLNWSLVDE